MREYEYEYEYEYGVPPPASGERIELRRDEGRPIHVLQNRLLSRGDEIELLLADGSWLRGHYDWSGLEARWPGLRIELGGSRQPGADDQRPAAVMALHPDAIVRRSAPRQPSAMDDPSVSNADGGAGRQERLDHVRG